MFEARLNLSVSFMPVYLSISQHPLHVWKAHYHVVNIGEELLNDFELRAGHIWAAHNCANICDPLNDQIRNGYNYC